MFVWHQRNLEAIKKALFNRGLRSSLSLSLQVNTSHFTDGSVMAMDSLGWADIVHIAELAIRNDRRWQIKSITVYPLHFMSKESEGLCYSLLCSHGITGWWDRTRNKSSIQYHFQYPFMSVAWFCDQDRRELGPNNMKHHIRKVVSENIWICKHTWAFIGWDKLPWDPFTSSGQPL